MTGGGDTGGGRLRLFVAVDVPEPVTATLDERLRPLRSLLPAARWTRPAGWHVTLKFLGSTAPEIVPEVEAAIDAAASSVEPFESRLTRVGAFPSPARARILWAGLDDGQGSFVQIVKELDDLLASRFEAEKRSFTPHLTLARIDPPARLPDAAPDLLSLDVSSDGFAVVRLVLYRSRLSPKGASYEPVGFAQLGGRGA